MKKQIYISGMKCQGCANSVESALNQIPGVRVLSIRLDGKFALVESAKALSPNEVTIAIRNKNFVVERIEDVPDGFGLDASPAPQAKGHHHGCC